ncbi:thiamine ABC transporter substrate-binding protein [Neoactinobaculum massilliense]|uniref:thiamine ABC transporter substrate-binding protein n=1 Tax=Neoactinobaculum massilliense TaxID=2364794 RepID=UPI000F54A764|nr:thiamine ABC transporter substrate-binding protein [Neoactinobaculum massilliense]
MKFRITSLLAAGALALAGCSGTGGAAGSASASASSGNGGVVTVMTHDSFNVPNDLIKKFEQESGYTVKTTSPGDAGTVVNQLVLADGKPGADAVYGIDTFSAYQAVDAGVLEDYQSPALPKGREAVEGQLNPIDDGFVQVNADKTYFDEHNLAVPNGFADLAKPEYAKLLVTENAAASSPGLAFLAGSVKALNGNTDNATVDTAAGKYWQQLIANGSRVAAGWQDAYYTDFSGADGKGNYPLVVSYSSSPAEGGNNVNVPGTAVQQTEYAAVLKGAKNPEGAKAFIDFMLSDDVQKSIPENMYMYPVADVPLPDSWAKLAPAPTDPVELTPKEAGANRKQWISMWREATDQ